MRFIKVKTVDTVMITADGRKVYRPGEEDVFLNLAMVRDFRIQVSKFRMGTDAEPVLRYEVVFFGDVDSEPKQRQVYGPIGATPRNFDSEVEALDWVFKSDEATGKKAMASVIRTYSRQRASVTDVPRVRYIGVLKVNGEVLTNEGRIVIWDAPIDNENYEFFKLQQQPGTPTTVSEHQAYAFERAETAADGSEDEGSTPVGV